MSNFIALTCTWLQSVTGSDHVNSSDANTLHAQKRHNAHANRNAGMVSYTMVIQTG